MIYNEHESSKLPIIFIVLILTFSTGCVPFAAPGAVSSPGNPYSQTTSFMHNNIMKEIDGYTDSLSSSHTCNVPCSDQRSMSPHGR